MKAFSNSCLKLNNQHGVTAVIVAITIAVFIGFAALAVDIGHLYVVRNELQNAADAGALAGARFLYNENGTAVNEGANQIGYDAAVANRSEKTAVDVHWSGGNSGDVERGHWSFATRTFTPNSSTQPPDLWDRSTGELDADPNFINAVRVRTRREDTPAASYFARIFGHQSFALSGEAVAYIGFAGTLAPLEVKQPIALCREALLVDGKYTCGVGRMINSGANIGHQTGGWTNFTQGPCSTASSNTVKPLVCGEGNPAPLFLGQDMGTTGGMLEAAFDDFMGCWLNAGLDTNGDLIPDQPWALQLPVIVCDGNNVGPCSEVVGSVVVNVVWVTRTDKNQMKEVPTRMGDWSCPSGSTPQQCWSSFVAHFQLRDVLNGTEATYEDKTIYFLPDCAPHIPSGRSGGPNFGILAKIPVLVR